MHRASPPELPAGAASQIGQPSWILLEVKKVPRAEAPAILDQEWVQPLASPLAIASATGPAPAAVYSLTSGRPYRLAVHREDPARHKWAGVRLHVRLHFADDDSVVTPDALAAFPPGSRSALTSWEVSLRMNRLGFTDEVFGIAASTEERGGRLFSIRVFLAADGGEAGSLCVQVEKGQAARGRKARNQANVKRPLAAPGADSSLGASRRPRLQPEPVPHAQRPRPPPAGSETPPAFALRVDLPIPTGDVAHAMALPPAPPLPAPNECTPSLPNAEAGPAQAEGAASADATVDDLVSAFGELCRFDPSPPPRLPPTPSPPPPLSRPRAPENAAGATFSAANAGPSAGAAPLRPLGLAFGVQASYAPGAEAERRGALELVEAAAAAVHAAAQAAGVGHFLALPPAPPRAVVDACVDLAAALSSPAFFETQLFTTRDGRYRTRQLIDDLRLSGSSELVDGLLASWRQTLLSVPVESLALASDAAALAQHVWNAIEVIAGHPHTMKTVDLVPVDREFIFSLLEKVDQVLAGHRGADPVLHVGALTRRAWLMFQYGDVEQALECYFTAWSEVIRCRLAPSRLEIQVLCELIEILLLVPSKWELADHLCSKVYWFATGDVEDKYLEAYASRTMGMVAMAFGRWKAAKHHLGRSAELVELLPVGYRLYAERLYKNLGHLAYHTGDFIGCLRYAWKTVDALSRYAGISWNEADPFSYSLRAAKAICDSDLRPGRMKRSYTMADFTNSRSTLPAAISSPPGPSLRQPVF
eukprot:tig00000857_g4951.t1